MRKLLYTFAFILLPFALPAATPVAGTVGNSLTAYPGGMGAMDNNAWNNMIAGRTGGGADLPPTANFGNCNAVIIRCASPKCTTGCTTMELARPIVQGCVLASAECKSHGDDLIEYISAQLVSSNVAKQNNAVAQSAAAAAQQQAAQSNAAMQQMQAQMAAIQAEQQQAAQTTAAALESALVEQRAMLEESEKRNQESVVRQQESEVSNQQSAISNQQSIPEGISADVLAREQAGNQILTQLENADVAMMNLRKTMQNAFDYAGCDANGNDCTGPSRARAFKQKAGEFFDPYNTVLEEVYDALIMAQSLGVDLTDIYMMMNGSCNLWGKYLCETCSQGDSPYRDPITGAESRCDRNGEGGGYFWTLAKTRTDDGSYKVAPNQPHCTLIQSMTDRDTAQMDWMNMGEGSSGGIRVDCMSDILTNSPLFRNVRKSATIDAEVLQRMIEQDAPNTFREGADQLQNGRPAPIAYCKANDQDVADLQKAVNLKRLTDTVCVNDDLLERVDISAPTTSTGGGTYNSAAAYTNVFLTHCDDELSKNTPQCLCENSGGTWRINGTCNCGGMYNLVGGRCVSTLIGNFNTQSESTPALRMPSISDVFGN